MECNMCKEETPNLTEGVCNDCYNLPDCDKIRIILNFRTQVEQLTKDLEAEREKNRWIPVSERLPEKDIDCLCFEGKFAGLGYYGRNSNTLRMQWQVNGFVSKYVTHWKPIILPEKD